MSINQNEIINLFKNIPPNIQTLHLTKYYSKGSTLQFRIGSRSQTGTFLQDTASGDAIAFQTEQGNWYIQGNSANLENRQDKRIITYNQISPPDNIEVGNIKILFSQIEDKQRVLYVLDEKSKKKVFSIDINVEKDAIQGNLFNYGTKSKYTSSLRYHVFDAQTIFKTSNLIALTIIGDTEYPLWDYTQIGLFDTASYHGSSVLMSQYISIPSRNVNEQTVITRSGVDRYNDTVEKRVYTYDIELSRPSIYNTLIGHQKTTIYSTFNAPTAGEVGFFGYVTTSNNGLITLRSASKSFYVEEKTTNQFDYITSVDTLETYSFSPQAIKNIIERSVIRLSNQNRITTGKTYLGKYVKKEISNTYTFQEDSKSHIEYIDSAYNNNTLTILSVYTLISKLNTNLLLIEGIKSSITCHVDYMSTYNSDDITDTRSNVPIDKCVYYFNNSNTSFVLNRTTSVVINNFGTTIVDEKTTRVINKKYDSLLPYIGQTFSYAQYIDANNCWLAKGTLTSVNPFTIITLTEITKVPFVSYATVNGTAISDNGSLFSLLSVLSQDTNIINTYILDRDDTTSHRRSFTELLKYGCLIGNKFYICQNNDTVKTSKTNLYVEQWDISNEGNIIRNNKLIKLPVSSLDSTESDPIIHSIQYWNRR